MSDLSKGVAPTISTADHPHPLLADLEVRGWPSACGCATVVHDGSAAESGLQPGVHVVLGWLGLSSRQFCNMISFVR